MRLKFTPKGKGLGFRVCMGSLRTFFTGAPGRVYGSGGSRQTHDHSSRIPETETVATF